MPYFWFADHAIRKQHASYAASQKSDFARPVVVPLYEPEIDDHGLATDSQYPFSDRDLMAQTPAPLLIPGGMPIVIQESIHGPIVF